MKMKLAVAFFAGAAFALAGVVIAGIVTPYAKAQDGQTQVDGTAPASDTSLTDLNNAFQQARLEIHDPDIAAYYDKLVSAYAISTPSDSQSSAAALPDVKNIQQAALTLPLQEAGKQINDPEIAQFYRKFLNDTGLSTPVPTTGTQ